MPRSPAIQGCVSAASDAAPPATTQSDASLPLWLSSSAPLRIGVRCWATAAFNENPSRATVNGFGTLDVGAAAASLSVKTLRPGCGPAAMPYWIDAAGLFCVNYQLSGWHRPHVRVRIRAARRRRRSR